jgi:hypothetical protein
MGEVMRIGVSLTGIALAGLVSASLVTAADAQAPAPIGNWATSDQRAVLLVTQNGRCMVMIDNQTAAIGSCTWSTGYGGGVLTIANVVGNHQTVQYHVTWQTAAVIKVGTLTFYKDRAHS